MCALQPNSSGANWTGAPQKRQPVIQGARKVEADNRSGRSGLRQQGLGSLPGECQRHDRLAPILYLQRNRIYSVTAIPPFGSWGDLSVSWRELSNKPLGNEWQWGPVKVDTVLLQTPSALRYYHTLNDVQLDNSLHSLLRVTYEEPTASQGRLSLCTWSLTETFFPLRPRG